MEAGDWEHVTLLQDSLVAMVHPEHPFAQKGSAELGELLQETLFFPVPDYPLHERLQRAFAAAGHPMPNGNSYSGLGNLSSFSLQSGKGGGSQGERLGSFSFAISLWNDKEMASKPAQRTRAKHSVSVIAA